jgi:hypothetical protein
MVSLCQPFSGDEVGRIVHVLQKLSTHDTHHWALTGGIALECQLARAGAAPRKRRFTELDFVVDSFDTIRADLYEDFLLNHVHHAAKQGKLCIQLVEPVARLRIDVFRACGDTMKRAVDISFHEGRFRMLTLEDLAARCTRVALGAPSGASVPAKHLEDHFRLAGHVDPVRVRKAWEDHREDHHSDQFEQTVCLLQSLTDEQRRLFAEATYNTEVGAGCRKCRELPAVNRSNRSAPKSSA